MFFDLFFNMIESDDGIRVDVDYSTELFDESTIQRWIGHLETMLAGLAANPDIVIGELPVPSPLARSMSAGRSDWAAPPIVAEPTPQRQRQEPPARASGADAVSAIQTGRMIDAVAAGPETSPAAARITGGTEPMGPLERQVHLIWSEVLGNPAILPDQPLFALGAQSLHIFRIAARMQKQGLKISAWQLMANPSIRDLAVQLSGGAAVDHVSKAVLSLEKFKRPRQNPDKSR